MKRVAVLLLLSLSASMIVWQAEGLYVVRFQDFTRRYGIERRKGIVPPETGFRTWLLRKLREESGGRFGGVKKPSPRIVPVRGELRKRLADLLRRSRENDGEEAILLPGNVLHPYLSSRNGSGGDLYLFLETDGRKGELFLVQPYASSGYHREFVTGRELLHPYRIAGWGVALLALLLYRFWPGKRIPKEAARHSKIRAVLLPDLLGFLIWWLLNLFFFYALFENDGAGEIPGAALALIVLLFSAFVFATLYFAGRYENRWYLVEESRLRWHGGEADLQEILSVCPYERPQVPRWLGPLILLFSRGRPGAVGTGLLASSAPPEYGIVIRLKDGREIPVVFNALQNREALEKLAREHPCKKEEQP
jgi:hypothetical protein